MAADDARSKEAQARPAASSPPSRGGRGLIGGLIGGVLATAGSIYALQIPEVRQNLPLPEEAQIVVNPEAVARINALETELAQVRDAVRETDLRQPLQTLSARVDMLSQEVTAAATATQLADLQAGLSPLASPEGAAALDERLEAFRADFTRLDEEAARSSSLATAESAIEGMEQRLAALEELAPALRADVDGLRADLDAAVARAGDFATKLEAAEAAAIERSGALTGRIDATARDVGDVQEDLGAAGARLDDQAGDLTTFGTRADALGTTVAALSADVRAVRAAVDSFLAEASSNADALAARVDETTRVADEAKTTADTAQTTITQALARARAGAEINAAATELAAALGVGAPLAGTTAALTEVDRSALSTAQTNELDEVAGVVGGASDGVASLAALQASFASLRPAVDSALAPAGDATVTSGVLGALQLRPVGRATEAQPVLDEIAQALDRGAVAEAAAAARTLPEAGSAVLGQWLAAADEHVALSAARQRLLDLGRAVTASAAEAT
ncbi:MAG: hypothetical protein AAFX81_00580 [Pseudomonadota bacterium]